MAKRDRKEFWKNYNKTPKRAEYLRDYWREWQNEYRKCNPDKVRNNRLKHLYGISLEEYYQLYAEQGGSCKICGKPETVTRKGKLASLCVDHDHMSGKVRSLLCRTCNRWVGLVEGFMNKSLKNQDQVNSIIEYLNSWDKVGDKQ